MKRRCSMCGSYKDETEFRFMSKCNKYNAYCKECEKWYQRHYVRKKVKKNEAKG